MADLDAEFDLRSNRLMAAWLHRDAAELKACMARDCLFLFGSTPPVMLDRPSFIAAIERDLVCRGFRFRERSALPHGGCVWFTGHLELEWSVAGTDWSGHFLLTDLWRKSGLRRRWQLAERTMAPLMGDAGFAGAIRALQLWR
ncbi:MAG: nuclear transport factor 2 family protein [Erythrobacter sp.]|jgi:hypothetical protein|nr:nuclear transport factor 2 family protein [Erythrobacter sp.]